MTKCIVHDQEIVTDCSVKECIYYQYSHDSFPSKYHRCILCYMAEQLYDKHEQLSISDISIILQIPSKEVMQYINVSNNMLRIELLRNIIKEDIDQDFYIAENKNNKICYFCDILISDKNENYLKINNFYVCNECVEEYKDITIIENIIRLENLYYIDVFDILSLVKHKYKNPAAIEQALQLNNITYQKLEEFFDGRK